MITMYDSTDRGVIPASAAAVAGYCGQHNHFQSYWWFVQDYPHAIVVPVLAYAQDDGPPDNPNICLDIEPGNSGPETAPGFIQREHSRGVKRPIIYAARADMQSVLGYCDAAGISRSSWRRWVAHPDGIPHICTNARCGYETDGTEATQYVWSPGGVNIDISLCADSFFAHSPTPPIPIPPEDTISLGISHNKDGRCVIAVQLASGEVKHIEQSAPNGEWWKDKDGHFQWLSLGNPGAAFPPNP